MLFNNRYFPHPVLGLNDDFKEGNFEVELKVKSNGEEIQVTPSFKLVNDDLNTLLKNTSALFVSHLYCRGTMYREVFKSDKSLPATITIPAIKLNGEVEIDFFLCADKELLKYSNKSFNDDYTGYSFSIDRADIIAYAGKGKFYANKSPEELKSISALMNIDNSKESKKPMYNEYGGQKITIMLCEEDYERYQVVKSNPIYANLLLSTVVLPALIEALHYMSADESGEFKDRRWYEVLSVIKSKSKVPDPFRIAQNILDSPNNRSFNTLIKLFEG